MHRRIPLLIAAVAALCLAIAVPTASAATKTDRAQTKAIKKQAKAIKKNSSGVKKTSSSVNKLNASAKALDSALKTLKTVADRADANGNAFVAAAPAVLKGLSDLRDGLLAAGAGLTTLQKLAGSQEYGYAQISVGGTPQQGAFVQTPDIPDTVQQASTSQQFVTPGGTVAGTTLAASYGIRGGEIEPTGPQGFCRTTVVNDTTGTTGTLPGDPIGAPGGSTTGFLTVATSTPFAAGFGPAGSDTPITAAVPTVTVTAGDVYTVNVACIDTPPISATDVTN